MQQPLQVREAREGLQLQLRDNTQETKYKNNHPGGSSGDLPDSKGKEDSMFYISTPNRPGDRRRYEGSEKMNTRGRMMVKILNRYNRSSLTLAPELEWSKENELEK